MDYSEIANTLQAALDRARDLTPFTAALERETTRLKADGYDSQIVDELAANATDAIVKKAIVLIEQRGMLSPVDQQQLLTEHRAALGKIVQHERAYGRLRPWTREDVEKRHLVVFDARGYNSHERSLMHRLLPEGDDWRDISWHECTTTSGLVVRRDDIDQFRPRAASIAGWEREKTPTAQIEKLQRDAAREEAERQKPRTYGEWNFNE
jgi:hypothetical protein